MGGKRKMRKNSERQEENSTNSQEILLPVLLKNGQPVKVIEDEIPVPLDNKDRIIENIKEIDDPDLFVHNGIQIRKMPKKGNRFNSSISMDSENRTRNLNKSEIESSNSILLN